MKTNKFKVIPNLSLKGKEIQSRLQNRSLILNGNQQYSLDDKIDEARRMSKLDILNERIKLQKSISNMQKSLQHGKI